MAEPGVTDPPDVDQDLEKPPPSTRDRMARATPVTPRTPPLSGVTPLSTQPAPPVFQPAVPALGPVAPPPVPYANIPTPNQRQEIPTPQRPYGAIPTPGPTPKWQTMTPQQLASTAGLPPLAFAMGNAESGMSNEKVGDDGLATGPWQIQTPTWHDFAPRVGVDVNLWPRAKDAPLQVQWAVAQNIPLSRWTAGQRGARELYPWVSPNMTVGQVTAAAGLAGPQQYIPASQTPGLQNRPPDQWGKPPPGGYPPGPGNMPSLFDMPRIMQQGLALLPLLSMFTRGGMIPAMTAFGSYVTGYQKGQLLKQELAKNQWKNELDETVARMERESIDYGDAFATYAGNEEELRQALGAVANTYNDDPMRAALANGGSAAAQRLLQQRDQYYTDLNKTKLAQEKQQIELRIKQIDQEIANTRNETERTRLEIEKQKLKNTQAGIGAETAPDTETPETGPSGTDQPDKPDTTTTEQPDQTTTPAEGGGGTTAPTTTPPPVPAATPPEPTQGRVQAPPTPPSPEQGSPEDPGAGRAGQAGGGPSGPPVQEVGSGLGPNTLPPELSQKVTGLTPSRLDQLARQAMETGDTAPFKSGDPLRVVRNEAVGRRVAQMQDYLDRVLSGIRPGDDPNTIWQKVASADPQMASTAAAIDRGDQAPPTSYAQRSRYWQNVLALVNRADPGWTEARYAVNQRTRVAFQVGWPAQQRVAANRALQHMTVLQEAAASLGNTDFTDVNALRNEIRRRFGDPAVTDFDVARAHVAQELERVFRGNAGAVREIERDIATVGSSASPGQIRGYLRTITELLKGQLDALADLYQSGTNRPTTGDELLSKGASQTYHRILADPLTIPPAADAQIEPPSLDAPPATFPAPPPEAIQDLKAHPNDPVYRRGFDETFGPGSADQILGPQ